MQKKIWTAAKYVALTLLGIALYQWGANVAYAERGYFAVGGEVFALFLPLFYCAISRSMRDSVKDWRQEDDRN